MPRHSLYKPYSAVIGVSKKLQRLHRRRSHSCKKITEFLKKQHLEDVGHIFAYSIWVFIS